MVMGMRGGGWASLGVLGLIACAACGLITGVGDLQVEAADGGASSGTSASSSSGGRGTSSTSSSASSSGESSTSSSSGQVPVDAGPPPLLLSCQAPGLIAYWKMNEGTGAAASDCSTSGIKGTLTTGVKWSAGRNGAAGAPALEFNGTEPDLLQLGDTGALKGTSAFTVSTWLYLVPDPKGSIIGRATTANTNSWSLGYSSSNVNAAMKDTATNTDLALTTPFSTMVWRHVTLVFRPNVAFELWVGNTLATSQTAGVPIATPNYGDVKIGHITDPGDAFGHLNGRLQQLRVFSRALSATEIAQLAAEP